MDKEDELFRSLLSNTRKTASAGFTETVMREVRAMEERRIRRRLILAIILRTAFFTGLFVLLVVPVVIRGISVDELLRLQKEVAEGIAGVLKNAYFLLPLAVLWIGRKLFAIK
jgi:hypothetical protein